MTRPPPRPRDPGILLYNGTSRQWLTQFSRRPPNVCEELESICVFSAAIKDISIRVKQIVNCLKTFARKIEGEREGESEREEVGRVKKLS